MAQSAQHVERQMNLPLLNPPAPAAACGDQQKELTLALVELLISAAGEEVKAQSDGGEDESETHA